jgi:hypothetical protein
MAACLAEYSVLLFRAYPDSDVTDTLADLVIHAANMPHSSDK